MPARLVSGSIPNLYNGVSQQSPANRLPSQSDIQNNAFSSIIEGLIMRPPLEHLAKLSSTPVSSAFTHIINRDTTERYVTIFTSGNVSVYDLAGTAKTVAYPDGTGYITDSDPADNFRAVTIADYTFLVNKSVTAAMGSALSPQNGNIAFVFVKQATNGVNYKVTLNGTTYTHTTAATGAVSTADIATALATAIGTGPGGTFTVTRTNYVLQITRSNTTAFTLTTEDSRAGEALKSFKDKVQHFTDLPVVCANGYIVEVVGDDTGSFDNFYVVFQTNDGSASGEGTWTETVNPNSKYQLDAATMPFGLVRQSDGTFKFQKLTWGNKTCGDDTTAPNPSFIGGKFADLFLYKNRLGLVSDENIIMSRAGKFFEYFRETVTTTLDTDPVDIAASHNKVSIIRHAVPYSEELILFSDQTQFRLSSDGLLTAATVSITPTTEYECSMKAKPVGAGANLYFAVNAGEYTTVREYFVSGQNDTKDAADVTAHVPVYIPKNVSKFASAPNFDILCCISPDEPNAIYVYKYFWQGTTKVQASWSKWTFEASCEILNIEFIDHELYVVHQYAGDGIYLSKINIAAERKDTGSAYLTLLDRRVTDAQCTVSYNSGTNHTTFTLPYKIPAGSVMNVVSRYSLSGAPEGLLYPILSQTTNTLVVKGNLTSQVVFIGSNYEFRYRFATQFIRSTNYNGTTTSVEDGRLQMRQWTLRYENSGRFNVEITPLYRDTSTYRFTGRILGSGNNLIGQVGIESGTFAVLTPGKNDEITIDLVNNSFLPCKFLSAKWTAMYSTKTVRV